MDPATRDSEKCCLIEPLLRRAADGTDDLAVVFMHNDGFEEKLSVGQIHSGALGFAKALEKAGVRRSETVIIALRHSPALIFSFWGSLYAGATPSIFPYLFPRPSADIFKRQILALVKRAGARAVVADAEEAIELKPALCKEECAVVVNGDVPVDPFPRQLAGVHGVSGSDDIAYLQFTSGTTGLQKGVRLSHSAIFGFVDGFVEGFEVRPDDLTVSWVPLFHDMGLFGGMIAPLIVGIPAFIMSPFKWVRNPQSFFSAIHRHRGTLGWMPNSAFNHAVNYVRERHLSGLDLSSLRCLVNAAEPIHYESQELFRRHFAPYGFAESALGAGYGLAENTLTVTLSRPGRRSSVDWVNMRACQDQEVAVRGAPGEPGVMPMVSSGSPVRGTEVAIFDDSGEPLDERRIGEVAVRGSSLFSGYQGVEDRETAWFRTGDLGYRVAGELYICGRKKDLIIVGGRNIYPEDLEYLAGGVSGVCEDRVAAFGMPDRRTGSERIVLVCDLEKAGMNGGDAEIEREIRRTIFRELDVAVSEVYLAKRGWVVKTPNGKISRFATRRKYEQHLSLT